jgi:MFS family permease
MRRVLVFVSAIVCFESTLYTVLAPLLPRLSEEFGLSKAEAGALVAAYAAGALVAAVPSGLLTARIGVKATAVGGVVLLGAASVAFGLASDASTVFAARFVQGCGSSLAWTAGFAWLVALAPHDRRGEVIGVAVAAALAGTLLGPALGTLATVAGPAPVFVGLAAPAFALAVWGLVLPAGPRQLLSLRMFGHALVRRSLLGPALLIALAGLLLGAISVLGPLRLAHLGWSTTAVGMIFLLTAAAATVLNPAVGRLSDRRGRVALLRATLAACALSAAALAVSFGYWAYAVVVVVGGVAFGLLWTPATALLSDATAALELDFALGFALLNLAWPPGQLVGAAVGGAVADATSDAVPYVLACALCIVALAALPARRAIGSPERRRTQL